MIKRFYVHNFRCLENFELIVSEQSSVLIIGNNGTGKSTVGRALEILQKVARGTNRISELVRPRDITRGQTEVPMRFEIEVDLAGKIYHYVLALELPEGFKELRVLEEKLTVAGSSIYSRETANVKLARDKGKNETSFLIDWHLVALPIVQRQAKDDPLALFKLWLSRMLILRPIPALMSGDSDYDTLEPRPDLSDFGAWFSGILAEAPSAYTSIDSYLRGVLPDLSDIKNPEIGTDSRSIIVHFSNEVGQIGIPFKELSDGEKCFMVCALVLAANRAYGPLLCFWDEPDSYLAISEVGEFILSLRKAFYQKGQFIATSHNEEAVRKFSSDNTIYLSRRSHLEPTTVRIVSTLDIKGDLVESLVRGDLQS